MRHLPAACLLALVLMLALPLSLPGAALAATVPTFYSDTLIVGGFSSPRSLDFLPDGRILVVENGGAFILVNGTTSTNLGTLTGISTSGEQGLLGVAIDPDFPSRPYVYVHYTTASNVQVARFNFTNASGPGPLGLDLASKLILLGDMPNVNTNHNGGTVRFGPDKTLYISIGDDATGGCDAQNLSFMSGKILRIKVDATIDPANRSTLAPSDNPFFGDPRVNATLVWAYGLRNPFRFDIDPLTGTLFIGDVGQSAWEEIDQVSTPGANLGWPYFEGNASYRGSLCPTDSAFPPVQYPIFTFANTGSAVIMPTIYRGVDYPNDFSFPPEFDFNAFYFDFYQTTMHVLRSPNNSTNWTQVAGITTTDFASGMQYTTDMQEGPDGALYWLSESTSALRRIAFDPVPQITTASLPPGTVGTAYDAALAATGVPLPFDWSIASGSLPGGLTIDNATGHILGTPSAAESASFVVQVNTSAGRSGTRALSIRVSDPVSIAPASLLDAVQNRSFVQPLAALGGAGPFTWALDSGALPPGMSLSTSTGAITGTCDQFGNWSFAVRLSDSDGRNATKTYSLSVIEELRVTTQSLPQGQLGSWFEQTLSASGGVAPYTWAVNASTPLPSGLQLGASNGTVYGMPASSGADRVDFDLQDSGGQFVVAGLDIVIAPLPGSAPIVATTTLADATIGVVYNASLASAGGSPPITWAVDAPALPPGISLSSSGPWLIGSPSAIGNWTFEVTVTDNFGRNGSRNLTLQVGPVVRGITITTLALPPGELGVAYPRFTLDYTGVNLSGQIRWDAVGLPAGLTLRPNQGDISGTPTEGGVFDVALRAYDNQHAGVESTRTLTLTIARVAITTPNIAPFVKGVGVILTLTAANASQPVTWSVVNGTLPPGITLAANGTISGTPTAAGTYNFTVRAVNPAAPSSNFEEKSFSVSVAEGLPPVPPPGPTPVTPPVPDFALALVALAVGGILLLAVLSGRRRRQE